MVGKLVTRRSTLGASRDERIESVKEPTSHLYRARSQSRSRGRSRRNDRYATEYDYYHKVNPRSIRYARSPKVDYSTTSCSITTTSSMPPTQEKSSRKLGRSLSFRRQSSRDPSPSNGRRSGSLTRQPSREPSNMRRSSSFRRQSSRDQPSSNMRRSTSLTRQSTREQMPSNIRRSSSLTRQPSMGSFPVNRRRSASAGRQVSTNSRQSSLRRVSPSLQSSRQSSRNLSSARSRHSSSMRSPARSRQSSSNSSLERSRNFKRSQSPARPRSSSRRSSRNYSSAPQQSILKQSSSFRRQSSRGQTSGLSSSGQKPRQPSRQPSRQASIQASDMPSSRRVSRSRSRSRSRSKAKAGSFSSSVLSSAKNTPSDHCEEKIELVAMKNENNQPFVRILVSKTSYKPKAGDGVEVVPSSEIERSRSAQLAHRRGQGNSREDALISQKNGYRESSRFSNHAKANMNKKQMTYYPLDDKRDQQNVDKYGRAAIDHTAVMDSIELPPCDPMDVAVTCITACTEPVPCRQVSERRCSRINSDYNACYPQRIYTDYAWAGDERDDRNAAYWTNLSSQRGLFSNTKFDLAEKYAKKEQEREEKKQKKIQKRMVKEAKRQIKNELRKGEVAKKEMRRSTSLNMQRHRRRHAEEDNMIPRVVKTFDDDLSSSSSEGGIFGIIKASLSNDRPKAPVRSVSFVSTEDRHFRSTPRDDDDSSRNTAAFQRTIHRGQGTSVVTDIGNICDCGVQDIRDMRMIESDISSSTDEESSDSSSRRYRSYRNRRY